ncbi:methylated-DNA--[protein]-cysteine S-methyltransferase [Dehalogenimonas sp. THU2]|uniref:methylated-DNA--[protein]-cysteine S-methyltransferase n=1 Tax=Dehalogenimonas sp. THU2 TaxID=3151121 RepID=UPI003218B072
MKRKRSDPETGNKPKYDIVESAAGWVGIEVTGKGVKRVTLPIKKHEDVLAEFGIEQRDLTTGAGGAGLADRLKHFFLGEPVVFKEGLDLTGTTEFQQDVYEAACRIPFGETKSYGELAKDIGKPGAARAVGQALGANPLPILIPCHRVVAADGGLGGFTGGVSAKKKLLEMEKSGKESRQQTNRGSRIERDTTPSPSPPGTPPHTCPSILPTPDCDNSYHR